jgi:hypothetical protein
MTDHLAELGALAGCADDVLRLAARVAGAM